MLPFRLTVKQFDLTSEQKWCSCVCELTEWEACDACTPVVGSDRKSSLACVVLLFHNLLFEDLFFFFFEASFSSNFVQLFILLAMLQKCSCLQPSCCHLASCFSGVGRGSCSFLPLFSPVAQSSFLWSLQS